MIDMDFFITFIPHGLKIFTIERQLLKNHNIITPVHGIKTENSPS